jgi:hypothetical protein
MTVPFRAMRLDSYYKSKKLHVQNMYIYSVFNSYILRQSSAIFREQRQNLKLMNYDTYVVISQITP